MKKLFLTIIITFFTFNNIAIASEGMDFESWLEQFKIRAEKSGISQKTIKESLDNISHIPRVIELDRKQPEFKMTFKEYQNKVITNQRVNEGKSLLKKHSKILRKIANKYGVQPKYIVALWGIETSYGKNTGGFNIIPALATLGWEGRRGEFFSKELINALKIIDEGHITPSKMKGSWAGAMGQNQFMPSSFISFAVDENNDGKKDIWNTKEDIFASIANYLNKSGWNSKQRWGREVKYNDYIARSKIGLNAPKLTLKEWHDLGVRLPNGKSIPIVDGMKASLIVFNDKDGKSAFLVYNNYNVIMKWNRSVYFATSVGLLADKISM